MSFEMEIDGIPCLTMPMTVSDHFTSTTVASRVAFLKPSDFTFRIMACSRMDALSYLLVSASQDAEDDA